MKKIIILSMLWLSVYTAFSQLPQFDYMHCYTADSVYISGYIVGVHISNITPDNKGNIIVDGDLLFSNGCDNSTYTHFLAMYDSSYNCVWQTNHSFYHTLSITINNNSEILALADNWSINPVFNGVTYTVSIANDYLFLLKFSSTGEEIIAIPIAPYEYVIDPKVVCSDEGDVYVSFSSEDSFTINNTTISNQGYRDAYLVKYDSLGQFQWIRSFQGTSQDNICDIDVCNNGIYAAVHSNSNYSFQSGTFTGSGSYIFKFSETGDIIWSKNYRATNVIVDKEENVIFHIYYPTNTVPPVTNFIFEGNNINLSTTTSSLLSKFDGNGNLKWYNSTNINECELHIDNFNNLFISYHTETMPIIIGDTTLYPSNGFNFLKFNEYGDFLGHITYQDNFTSAKNTILDKYFHFWHWAIIDENNELFNNVSCGPIYEYQIEPGYSWTINGNSFVARFSIPYNITDTAIQLPQGWSIFSSYIEPMQNDIETFFYEVAGTSLQIVKDNMGNVYWPLYNINNIGLFDISQGYQLRMLYADSIHINGIVVEPSSIHIECQQGWNLIGYPRSVAGDIVNMMQPVVQDIIIMKSYSGEIYWPVYNVNSIVNMQPWQGYQVKMSSAVTFTYPDNNITSSKSNYKPMKRNHFTTPEPSDNNMTLCLVNPQEWLPISTGDEIGIFTMDNVYAGSSVYGDGNIAVTLWGDDALTNQKEGMTEGDVFIIKLWQKKTNKEILIDPQSYLFIEGNDSYLKNGLTAVEGRNDISDCTQQVLMAFPNPFDMELNILFYLPADDEISISATDVVGRETVVIPESLYRAGSYNYTWQTGKLESGIYNILLRSHSGVEIKQVVHIK